MPVALDYKSDHLVVRMVGPAIFSTIRRSIVIPYSDIRDALVEAPRWPSVVKEWRLGTHFPGLVAHGTFVTWKGSHRRFLFYERSTTRALTIKLEGHPDFEEVSIEVRDPDAAQKELLSRRR